MPLQQPVAPLLPVEALRPMAAPAACSAESRPAIGWQTAGDSVRVRERRPGPGLHVTLARSVRQPALAPRMVLELRPALEPPMAPEPWAA